MNRERIIQGGAIATVLIVGLLIGWYFDVHSALDNVSRTAAGNTFREWFWEQRTLDLLVQVALIFVGALGVAAVLPKHAEQHPPDDI